ncbi:hypothetical protein Tco_0782439 [Tanacetum coccineum]
MQEVFAIKDEDGEDVDVHVYRSMIGSLMYLTASRPDIMFAVCACARFQVTPKASHLNAVKGFLGLELILLGTTLSTVSVKFILPGKYYYCWMKLVLLGYVWRNGLELGLELGLRLVSGLGLIL